MCVCARARERVQCYAICLFTQSICVWCDSMSLDCTYEAVTQDGFGFCISTNVQCIQIQWCCWCCFCHHFNCHVLCVCFFSRPVFPKIKLQHQNEGDMIFCWLGLRATKGRRNWKNRSVLHVKRQPCKKKSDSTLQAYTHRCIARYQKIYRRSLKKNQFNNNISFFCKSYVLLSKFRATIMVIIRFIKYYMIRLHVAWVEIDTKTNTPSGTTKR